VCNAGASNVGRSPWLMARWKSGVEFLLSVIEVLFLSLAVEVLQGKTCRNSLPSGGVGHLEPRFQGKGSSVGNIFGFYKTRHILLSNSANCTVLRATCRSFDTIPACDGRTERQTDRQTDGQTELP